jgi:hypothetical protein
VTNKYLAQSTKMMKGLAVLIAVIVGFAIDQARAQPQTRLYGSQGRSIGTVGHLPSLPSPIFLQINNGTRGAGLLRVLVPPICYEE